MKIQLSSTLPFSPVQLDTRHDQPRRVVGQLMGVEDGREFCHAVYQFRHSDDDTIHYLVDTQERVYRDQSSELSTLSLNEMNVGAATVDAASSEANSDEESLALVWIEHDDTLAYKPYAFLVMNAITKLVADWDGVIYHTPSGERLRDSVWNSTLQVVDACVSNRFGLWVMVNLTDKHGSQPMDNNGAHQMGWVPL